MNRQEVEIMIACYAQKIKDLVKEYDANCMTEEDGLHITIREDYISFNNSYWIEDFKPIDFSTLCGSRTHERKEDD